jgi:glycosyltransferase involved in cell wall biosynthesis
MYELDLMESNPEVLVLCQLFYPELVSTGQTLTELCEFLSELGMEVEVLCGPLTIIDRKTKVPKYLKYKGIKIKRVWGTRFPKLSFTGKFINQVTYASSIFFRLLLEDKKKPVLVLTNPPFLGVICAVLRFLGGNPYIYLIFDVYPDIAVKLGVIREKSVLTKLWNFWNRFILKHASIVVVLGEFMKDVILNKGEGIPTLSKKTKKIHIWSDDRIIHPVKKEKNPFVDKWNLQDKFIVSYSGNMGRFHDMETIMKAAKKLMNYRDIIFLFVGEGYKRKWMKRYAEKWNLTNCQFHTYVERENYNLSLSCADIGLVSLASGQEGLSVPSKTFGFLSAGLPVIAIMSSKSEIALMIKESNCGLVIEPGDVNGLIDSILSLYHDKALLKELGEKSLSNIKNKYNLKNAALEYFFLINSLQDRGESSPIQSLHL